MIVKIPADITLGVECLPHNPNDVTLLRRALQCESIEAIYPAMRDLEGKPLYRLFDGAGIVVKPGRQLLMIGDANARLIPWIANDRASAMFGYDTPIAGDVVVVEDAGSQFAPVDEDWWATFAAPRMRLALS